jgi:hypothetical protein
MKMCTQLTDTLHGFLEMQQPRHKIVDLGKKTPDFHLIPLKSAQKQKKPLRN